MYTPSELRKNYEQAVQNGEEAKEFWEELAGYVGLSGIVLAYKASARALMARFSWNPYDKYNFVREAMKIFERAVLLDPQNIEIRFLRFAVQHYIPGFLDQSENLEEDKSVMIAQIGNYKDFELEKAHALTFLRFYEESERFTDVELERMRKALDK